MIISYCLKEPWDYNQKNIFVSTTKIGKNASNILNCIFFQNKLTLYHIKLYIYIQKTNFTFCKQYLFVPPFSRKEKRTHTDQSMYKFSYFVWKVMTSKPSHRAVVKTLFSSAYVNGITCLDECFLFYLIAEIHMFNKNLLLPWHFFQPCSYYFEISILKEVCVLHYLYHNSAIVILKFQKSCWIIYIC